MTQRSETYQDTAPAVDYELVSGDTGREIKIPKRRIPSRAVVLPRWCFYLLLGFALIGLVAGVVLVSAVLAFVK
jgi:hypothetical protein